MLLQFAKTSHSVMSTEQYNIAMAWQVNKYEYDRKAKEGLTSPLTQYRLSGRQLGIFQFTCICLSTAMNF